MLLTNFFRGYGRTLRQRIIWLILFLAWGGAQTPVFCQSVPVPLSHWVYPFLERMELKHFIKSLGDSKPYSRLAVAKALKTLANKESGAELTAVEQGQLELLQEEFDNELSRLGQDTGDREKWHIYRWSKDRSLCVLDYVFRQTIHYYNGQSLDQAQTTAFF